jgi:hypothetical protein
MVESKTRFKSHNQQRSPQGRLIQGRAAKRLTSPSNVAVTPTKPSNQLSPVSFYFDLIIGRLVRCYELFIP